MPGKDDTEPINEFVSTLGVEGFPHAIDADGSLWELYGVTSQPAFAFINDDGTIETHVGALGEAGLMERIEALAAS